MKNNHHHVLSLIKSRIEFLARIDLKIIDDETHLISNKIFDSLGVINLILDLEKNFSISFDENDMLSDEFMTPKGLANIVNNKLINDTK